MSGLGWSTAFVVDNPPAQAFAAIIDVRGWWSEEIEGPTDMLGGEFTYHYQDVHRCTMRVVELVPSERVVWLCLDNSFSFNQDKTEWIGTRVTFSVSREGDTTHVAFTHEGLVPEYECFAECSTAWAGYISGSLKSLMTTGTGRPNKAEAKTAALAP
ncbi:SRPBCC domain-containing protein [Acidothermaceae bacterium B102]|nr:SRPBCC domain-containing protein [Acidothermaceae bacterium B102]